jgi:tetratricopeptide (TPR) repeat protein
LARKAGERFRLARALIAYSFNLSRDEQVEEAKKHFKEAQKVIKELGSISEPFDSIQIGLAEIEWLKGNRQRAIAMIRGAQTRLQLIGDKITSSYCLQKLGLLSIEEEDLEQAQIYLEEALSIAQNVGLEYSIAEHLMLLSALFYLQGDKEKSKQLFRKSIPLAKNLSPTAKIDLLAFLFISPYFETSENGVILLGTLDVSQKKFHRRLNPLTQRYPDQARAHACNSLGKEAVESALAEGRKMSLEEALDLALKTMEEI